MNSARYPPHYPKISRRTHFEAVRDATRPVRADPGSRGLRRRPFPVSPVRVRADIVLERRRPDRTRRVAFALLTCLTGLV